MLLPKNRHGLCFDRDNDKRYINSFPIGEIYNDA